MNRLQRELHRLYMPRAPGVQATDCDESRLDAADGTVRAMVMELSMPADWLALSKVWHGVQADLELPAPAIAVSGTDGFQLWFSITDAVPAADATAFLESLRLRYLNDIKAQRVLLMPALEATSARRVLQARLLSARQAEDGRWPAFVAPDLAPLFAETPWLDLPPSPDGQASLLSGLQSMALDDFRLALGRLRPGTAPALPAPAPAADGAAPDPRRFLLDVMYDETVSLALRIEAAKALLPHFDDPRRC